MKVFFIVFTAKINYNVVAHYVVNAIKGVVINERDFTRDWRHRSGA